MCEHGTKTILVFLPADGKASWSLIQSCLLIIRQHSATRKHLFLYPRGDRSGLRKPHTQKKIVWFFEWKYPSRQNILIPPSCTLLQYGSRSSWSTADLLTVVSHKIARAFNRPGANQAAALDISKAFEKV